MNIAPFSIQQRECANFLAAIPDVPLAHVIILFAEDMASTAFSKAALSRFSNTSFTASHSICSDASASSIDSCFN
jgi:hypothetical protein